MKKDLLICFSSKGREDYLPLMLNLMDSVKTSGWDGDCRFYSLDGAISEYNGMPIIQLHGTMPQPKAFPCYLPTQMPYQFKFGLIQLAREEGYERIIWLDSSMRIILNISELLDQAPHGVVAFHNLGHDLYKYIADHAIQNLEVAPSDLNNILQTWGGAIMFDFTKKRAGLVFDDIVRQFKKGSFNEGGSTREGFVAHRHDQAVMSVIFNKYEIELLPYGAIVTSEHDHEPFAYGKDFYIRYGR